MSVTHINNMESPEIYYVLDVPEVIVKLSYRHSFELTWNTGIKRTRDQEVSILL
jgi:hypothetical protein